MNRNFIKDRYVIGNRVSAVRRSALGCARASAAQRLNERGQLAHERQAKCSLSTTGLSTCHSEGNLCPGGLAGLMHSAQSVNTPVAVWPCLGVLPFANPLEERAVATGHHLGCSSCINCDAQPRWNGVELHTSCLVNVNSVLHRAHFRPSFS